MKKLMKLYPSFLVCYEAGPTGYDIYWLLLSLNIDFTVVAPSRIPKISANKIALIPPKTSNQRNG